MRSILLILMLSLLFVGCINDSDSGNSTNNPSIVGIWQNAYNSTYQVTFRSDGTYSSPNYGFWYSGTYTTNGKNLTLQSSNKKFELEYLLDGNFLSIIDRSESSPSYHDFIRVSK